MIDLKLPNIGNGEPEEQLRELKSYLYQLVEALNWALQTLEKNMGKDEEKGA